MIGNTSGSLRTLGTLRAANGTRAEDEPDGQIEVTLTGDGDQPLPTDNQGLTVTTTGCHSCCHD